MKRSKIIGLLVWPLLGMAFVVSVHVGQALASAVDLTDETDIVEPQNSVPSRFLKADRVTVEKSKRIMSLWHDGELIKTYNVALGTNPVGAKKMRGDNKTPEGLYYLDRVNHKSKFYKSVHISYPNRKDIAEARKLGASPGGDIMVHGLPKKFEELGSDHVNVNWTKGCIALSNTEISDFIRHVRVGTPIEILP